MHDPFLCRRLVDPCLNLAYNKVHARVPAPLYEFYSLVPSEL
jgi:hypothetical protein